MITLKASENQRSKVFRCFQRDQEGTLGKKVNPFLVFFDSQKDCHC